MKCPKNVGKSRNFGKFNKKLKRKGKILHFPAIFQLYIGVL
jgi:hypothetical protein